MALLLRNNIPFKIYAGLDEIVITTEDVPFRDQEFKQILINGEKTSLTTDMGPGWETWNILREYVQNSRDEENSNVIACTEIVEPKEGYTRFYIAHDEQIIEVINNWDKYFTFDRIDAIVENKDGKLFPQIGYEDQGLYLFKRGIRCYTGATKTMYHYDMSDFALNESRVVENTYQASKLCAKFLCSYATVEVAANILRSGFIKEEGFDKFEGSLEYYYYGTHTLNDNWLEAIGNKSIVVADVGGFYGDIVHSRPCYLVSKEMARAIRKAFPEVPVYGIGEGDQELVSKPVEKSPKVEYMLKKAQEFLSEVNYKVTKDIEVVEFNESSILGHAGKGYIEISDKVFNLGMKELVMTIMEENEHIVTGHGDKTRELQDHLFRMWLSTLEEKHGIFL